MIGIGMKEGTDDSPQVLRIDQQDRGASGRENVEIQDLTPKAVQDDQAWRRKLVIQDLTPEDSQCFF